MNIVPCIIEGFRNDPRNFLTKEVELELNTRFNDIFLQVIRVGELYQKTAANGAEYANDVAAVIEAIDTLPENFQEAKALRKYIRVFLAEKCGFSATRISKLMSARARLKQLKSDGAVDAANWMASLHPGAQYELSRLSSDGFTVAWSKLSEWGTKTVSRDELRKLQERYPVCLDEKRGRWPRRQPSLKAAPEEETCQVTATPVAVDAEDNLLPANTAEIAVTSTTVEVEQEELLVAPKPELTIKSAVALIQEAIDNGLYLLPKDEREAVERLMMRLDGSTF